MLDLDSTFLYIEDTPGLNNIDWSVNIQPTLRELIAGNLAEVRKLPKGDITKFKPTRIYEADTSTTFRSVRQTTTPSYIRLPVMVRDNQKCGDNTDADGDCGEVYLVVWRGRF